MRVEGLLRAGGPTWSLKSAAVTRAASPQTAPSMRALRFESSAAATEQPDQLITLSPG